MAEEKRYKPSVPVFMKGRLIKPGGQGLLESNIPEGARPLFGLPPIEAKAEKKTARKPADKEEI